MKKYSLSKDEIKKIQQNREPYLMIDYATEVIPGTSAKGYKDLKKDEWFFKVHWPNDPNMPGMLQLESIVQMSALSLLILPGNQGKIVYITTCSNIKFIKKVEPNNRLMIETFIKSFKRGMATCEGKGFINEELVCTAKFNLVVPHLIEKYKIK
jgi:3-hydroxyacyl-[acyl-carrier-protein] dehydratase